MNRTHQAMQLTGANYKGDRRALDFYPTPPDCTEALLNHLELHPSTKVWEPACGDGAMSKVLEAWGFEVFSTDIADNCYGQGCLDFLKQDVVPSGSIDAIITNPPFNLSVDFIEKALGMAPIVAMLLKSQYWHAKGRLELFERTKPAWVLPLTWRPDFVGKENGGGKPIMEMCWTVWQPEHKFTKYKPLARPTIQTSLF